ncbi:MAG: DSD1 family PLP-dependent enzyme [Pirellulaceae bacterium]
MTNKQLPPLGATLDQIDTPALCLDLDIFEANTRAVAGACKTHGKDWRPHSKCHKSPEIARRQMEAGAIGVTCAKLGEAEVMAAGGVTDVLIANYVVGPLKIARLVELRRIADPIVCVDHVDQLAPLGDAMQASGQTLRVLIEVDIGMQRAGVAAGEPTLELARRVARRPGLQLAGVMGYEGHLLMLENGEEKRRKIHAALDIVADAKQMLEANDIPCGIVSCGGTGSYIYTVEHPAVTELQAGGAVFMDAFYRNMCHVPDLEYAMSVIVTVVSRPAPNRAIIDAGRKTLNIEQTNPLVVDRPGVEVARLSAEHGLLQLAPEAQDLRIGERLTVIPGYSDLTAVLHDEFLGIRDGKLEVIWPLRGRGRLQ